MNKKDFIREIIEEDLRTGKHRMVCTRFPPEPNGYLHIGHAKAVCLDFGVAQEYGGACNLRFDDSNPTKEKQEYIDAIKADIRWLGYDWGDHEYYASDYFIQLYEWALQLIKKGKAYVDDLSAEQIREYRGTLIEPGTPSPFRDRSIEENLDLFERMKNGEFPDGAKVLRAKIDMAAGNMNMRDPVMYRIIHTAHHRQGDAWCIYPTYDWTHGQSDSIERITHSLCSIEFEDHRPLYDWFLEQLGVYHPRQIEFARLNITYILTSTRKLRRIVEQGHVRGWDDPRMPTLAGLRRRGYTPASIRDFCGRISIAKAATTIDIALLEHCLREDLNKHASRVMAVIDPVKLVIDNYPEHQVEELDAINNPEDPSAGTRKVPFSRVLYIERDDFREDAPRKFYRLTPGREVRLRYAYFVKCVDVIRDNKGIISEIHCTYDPATRGGDAPDGRKVKATLHWVSAHHARQIEVRLFEHLFIREDPNEAGEGQDFMTNINPQSIEARTECYIEPGVMPVTPGDTYQFERLGYFTADQDTHPDRVVFNRSVTLRDTWAKVQQQRDKAL